MLKPVCFVLKMSALLALAGLQLACVDVNVPPMLRCVNCSAMPVLGKLISVSLSGKYRAE